MANQLERLGCALSSHYTIEREIGSGGVATVYPSEDLRHHQAVATREQFVRYASVCPLNPSVP